MRPSGRSVLFAYVAGSVVLAGAGCSSQSESTAAAEAAPGCPVEVTDGWVKSGSEEMTAGFGTLVNAGSQSLTVAAASAPGADRVELHEVVDDGGTMVMRPDPDGFEVPAGGSFTLEPGGSHLMLMGLAAPLRAGEEVQFTLTCTDGSSAAFSAQVKDYAGAKERYDDLGTGGDEHGGSS